MQWQIASAVIDKIYVGDTNIICPWGIETADRSSFFSLERGVGYRYAVLSEEIASDSTHHSVRMSVKMTQGKWDLLVNESIVDETTIVRNADVRCVNDSYFMDFVMRFRFRKDVFDRAEIAGETILHRDSNTYYQFPVRSAILLGQAMRVELSVINAVIPSKMELFTYVRDQKDEWIVHMRMLPRVWDEEVIKLCNRWCQTRPLLDSLSNIALKSNAIRKALWYRGEQNPFRSRLMRFINPNAFPLVRLPAGEHCSLSSQVKIVPTNG
jgi:hypothetical protein